MREFLEIKPVSSAANTGSQSLFAFENIGIYVKQFYENGKSAHPVRCRFWPPGR